MHTGKCKVKSDLANIFHVTHTAINNIELFHYSRKPPSASSQLNSPKPPEVILCFIRIIILGFCINGMICKDSLA